MHQYFHQLQITYVKYPCAYSREEIPSNILNHAAVAKRGCYLEATITAVARKSQVYILT